MFILTKNLIFIISFLTIFESCLSLKLYKFLNDNFKTPVENYLIENDLAIKIKRAIPRYKQIESSELNGKQLQFIISKVDIDSNKDTDINSLSTIPIILPAQAQITLPTDKADKPKKNFSKMAKSLIVSSRNKDKKQNDLNKANRYFTSTIMPSKANTTRIKMIEMNEFCNSKKDGLYDDPNDCENFLICFANRTFKTKCAFGTLWNHLRKECDYPEKVDCNRIPTTIETTTTTTTKTTFKPNTILMFPKLSVLTNKPNQSNTIDHKSSLLSTNIIIASIVIPGAILLIVAIVLTLWYWNRKFKIQNRKLEMNRQLAAKDSKDEDAPDNTNNDKVLLNKLSSCCCYKKLSYLAAYHKQFKPKMINSCGFTNKEDRIRSQSNFISSKNTNLPDKINSQISFPIENQGYIQEVPDPAPIVLNECQIANASHATLSSHFEENNWDYNFATRGLYLSQPWVRGRYTHTLGSESIATSGVLTLDPTTEISAEINGNKLVEIYGDTCGSDTDGYYA